MKRMPLSSVSAWIIAGTMCCAPMAQAAATNYVWQDSPSEASPYTSWDTAAHNIQSAVVAAAAGNIILVTNGTYSLTSMVTVSGKTLRSVNGKDYTFVNGGYPTYTNGCFRLETSGTIEGFTITNAYKTSDNGGGVDIYFGTLRNCTIKGNSAVGKSGGGVYIYWSGLVDNCLIAENSALYGGGFKLLNGSGGIRVSVVNSVISNNTVTGGGRAGGGAYIEVGMLSNCVVVANRPDASTLGGGVYVISATIVNCIVRGNAAGTGGGLYINSSVVLRNSLICDNLVNNSGIDSGGGIFFYSAASGSIENCTIVSNTTAAGLAASRGGGVTASGASTAVFTNTIVYSNLCLVDRSRDNFGTNMTRAASWNYCCTTPTNNLPGVANLQDPPLFVDFAAGNYRLARNSPCIDKGTNVGWTLNGIDLDRKRRTVNAVVDMGAYEFLPIGTVISLR